VQPGTTSVHLQGCLNRWRAGELAAREELLRHSQARLRELTARMLSRAPAVRRWEDTDDVLQEVLLRLDQTLGRIEVVSVRDYLCLAATNLRRVLVDLIRHYNGPHGLGAHHVSPPPGSCGEPGRAPVETAADSGDAPASIAQWSEFHEKAAALPDAEREVFDLLYYHGLTQDEAAELLGISLSTVKRRWQAGRLGLMQSLGGAPPL
jgi:RNA polymerase sigma factor (sigma-70 family)